MTRCQERCAKHGIQCFGAVGHEEEHNHLYSGKIDKDLQNDMVYECSFDAPCKHEKVTETPSVNPEQTHVQCRVCGAYWFKKV